MKWSDYLESRLRVVAPFHDAPLTTACETEHRERLAGVQGAGNEAIWSPERLTLTT